MAQGVRAYLDAASQATFLPGNNLDHRQMKSYTWDCMPVPGKFPGY